MRRGLVSARALLLGIIAAQLAALYVVMRNSSWVFDDNFFLLLAGQEGFTWHWLTSVQFEHWDIGEHALISLQHRLFYVDYRWALGLMLALLGGSTYVLERTLALVVRRRWISIAFAAWFGVSLLWARPLQWWAAGVQYFPYTFFDLLCLYSFMRYHAGGSWRWIAFSAVSLGAALLFYEKPAFMLFYLALLRALLLSGDSRPRALLRSFWRERLVWLAYIAVVLIWGVGYLHSHAYSPSGSHAGIDQYLSYFRIFWFQTLVPSLLGLTIPASNLSDSQMLWVVAGQVLVFGVVVMSLLRSRAAWRGWLFLLVTMLVGGTLVARSRIGMFGVGIANDPRYLIDYSWLVPLALCAAFAKDGRLRPQVSAGTAGASPRPLRASLGPVVLSLLLLGYGVVSVASAAKLQSAWNGPRARNWEQGVRNGIASLQRRGIRPMVADNAVPFGVSDEFLPPYNWLSLLLPMYVGPIQVDGPLDAPLVSIDEHGGVHRVALSAPIGDGGMSDLVRSHRVMMSPGGRTVRQGDEVCVIADGTPVTVSRGFEQPPASGGPLYLELSYRVWDSTRLPIVVAYGNAQQAATGHTIELTTTARRSLAWVGSKGPSQVAFTVPPQMTICMARMDLVSLKDESWSELD